MSSLTIPVSSFIQLFIAGSIWLICCYSTLSLFCIWITVLSTHLFINISLSCRTHMQSVIHQCYIHWLYILVPVITLFSLSFVPYFLFLFFKRKFICFVHFLFKMFHKLWVLYSHFISVHNVVKTFFLLFVFKKIKIPMLGHKFEKKIIQIPNYIVGKNYSTMLVRREIQCMTYGTWRGDQSVASKLSGVERND